MRMQTELLVTYQGTGYSSGKDDRIARNSVRNGLLIWQRRSNCSELSEKRFTNLAKTTELLMLCTVISD
jgi:hypothetical protein